MQPPFAVILSIILGGSSLLATLYFLLSEAQGTSNDLDAIRDIFLFLITAAVSYFLTLICVNIVLFGFGGFLVISLFTSGNSNALNADYRLSPGSTSMIDRNTRRH
jgi:hypothetical protein